MRRSHAGARTDVGIAPTGPVPASKAAIMAARAAPSRDMVYHIVFPSLSPERFGAAQYSREVSGFMRPAAINVLRAAALRGQSCSRHPRWRCMVACASDTLSEWSGPSCGQPRGHSPVSAGWASLDWMRWRSARHSACTRSMIACGDVSSGSASLHQLNAITSPLSCSLSAGGTPPGGVGITASGSPLAVRPGREGREARPPGGCCHQGSPLGDNGKASRGTVPIDLRWPSWDT